MKKSSNKKTSQSKQSKKTVSKNKMLLKKQKDTILKLEEEIVDSNNKYIRLLSEFDNYKKRNEAEKSKMYKYEGEEVIKSLLPIIDDLDRTLNIADLKKINTVYTGIEMILEKVITSLDNIGVKMFDSINNDFDIELHEALMTKKSKLKSNIIIEEFENGYKYHDKVIRHAKVIVSE